MLWFVLGAIFGIALARLVTTLKTAGELKYTIDDGELYFFMHLNTNEPEDLLRKKYVILEVDPNQTQN